ncbi:MAG: hypothetical protein PHV33_07535 [Elusimicrobiales bacterium]|nr:hypothetical protein [Elusimicrobiales bacterium]
MTQWLKKRRRASALIEVVLGSIILAMAVAALGGILLSSFRVKDSGQVRFSLAEYSAALKEDLKNYVTADTSITLNAPGSPPWHMPEDASCAACWALSPGTHDVSSRLPSDLRTTYGATLKYVVTNSTYKGRTGLNVKISTDWTAP